jgi:branched-chain amino acid transport system ATP-binding protein
MSAGDPAEVLIARNISVRFGGVQALKDVSLSLASGQVSGVVGPNGAGKTTLFDVLSGLLRPQQGRVSLNGQDIRGKKPEDLARLGLARTFQNLRLLPHLTVVENVMIGAYSGIKSGPARSGFMLGRGDKRQAHEVASSHLSSVQILDVADRYPNTLPYGIQKRVELARALALQPTVLLLDEPFAGMMHQETDDLGDLIQRLADNGLAVLLVEHDVAAVSQLCAYITVLDFGQVLAAGHPRTVLKDAAVVSAYLGAE